MSKKHDVTSKSQHQYLLLGMRLPNVTVDQVRLVGVGHIAKRALVSQVVRVAARRNTNAVNRSSAS